MNKQIEEMARELCSICHDRHKCENTGPCAMAEIVTEGLYEKGYRKQREGEWAYEHTGEWLLGTDAPLDYKCSLCGCLATDPFSYCPDCGAKMKGGE